METKVKNASIFITGANGGMGLESVKLLIEDKAKKILLACRTMEKANWTKSQLVGSHNTQLEPYGGFDMTNADSIAKTIAEIPDTEKFDIVFLQSGSMVVANNFQFIGVNEKSVEKTIYQNVIGAYITLLNLKKKNLLAPNARIVFAGGEGARGIKGMIEKPEFSSVEDFRMYINKGQGKYSDINALGMSKFMSALLVQKLAIEDPKLEYVWFSPGLTAGTNGLRDVPNPKRFIMEKIGFPMMQLFGLAQSPQKAAGKYVDCLNGIYGKSGDLMGAPEGKALGKLVDQKPMNSALTNHQFRDVFWKITNEVGGKW